MPDRKRGSDRDIHSPAEADLVRVAMEVDATTQKQKKDKVKKLKYARSHAELVALRQRRIQICLVATNVMISALIALKSFGII